MTFALFNWVCWGLFGLVWIFGAVYNSYKAPETKEKVFRYDWLILTIGAWLASHFAPQYFHSFLSFRVLWLQIIGVIFLVISTFFTLWSRWALGKMWATHAAVKADHQLITNGPYRITRHPIYTGILGMILGSAFSLGGGATFLGFIAILLFFLNRIRLEEHLMIETFGEAYLNYKRKIPQLVPGLRLH